MVKRINMVHVHDIGLVDLNESGQRIILYELVEVLRNRKLPIWCNQPQATLSLPDVLNILNENF